MTTIAFGFARRLTLALAVLLLAFGVFVGLLGRQTALEQEQEIQQQLSRGLARHIVEHWPEVTSTQGSETVTRRELLRMLMIVNPNIQVYLLDADGRVAAYIGEPGMVRTPVVDLQPIRDFLGAVPLPLRGTDPMGGGARLFSAAMFPPRPGDTKPPGYLYVVLQGAGRAAAESGVTSRMAWQRAGGAIAIALVATVMVGGLVFWRLTLPLNRLARRMRDFGGDAAGTVAPDPARRAKDEVDAIGRSFAAMTTRITEQMRARELEAAAHREVMADVAHDLRTPLTALHGQLEALVSVPLAGGSDRHARLLHSALAQSDRVRRMSQQLFELATLQSTDHRLERERFSLAELLTDTVQKFDVGRGPPRVVVDGLGLGPHAQGASDLGLTGPDAPVAGLVDCEADLHLVERALTNLIDNAIRHAAGDTPVRVGLRADDQEIAITIADSGPGLPDVLAARLNAGQPVRQPPLPRPGAGVGGFGLAIAQRIAALHGGSLNALASEPGGTTLAFVIPRWPSAYPAR